MTPDPKKLLQLLSIAEAGSFTKAAAANRISQPALSNSMAVLERALGVRLLNRSKGGATLTDYGRLLVSHAQSLSVLLTRAETDVELKKQGNEGVLSIGASPLACVELVPNAIARLLQKTPKIQVSLFERPDDQLIEGLRTGHFDVVINPRGAHNDLGDVVQEPVMGDTSVVIMRRGHSMARRRYLILKELQDVPWVLPDPHTAMWRHIEALFAAEDVPWPSNPVITDSVLGLRALMLRTDSVTLSSVHLMKMEVAAGQLVAVPLRKPRLSREIVMRTRRGPPLAPVTQGFVAALRAEAIARRRRA